jgi:hypothetical protein
MALFLKESQEKNGYSLVGDLGSLYRTIEKMRQEKIAQRIQKQKPKYELGALLKITK